MPPRPASIDITSHDRRRLRAMLASLGDQEGAAQREIRLLERELDRATIVTPDQVRGDVVTMGTCVVLRDLDRGMTQTTTLSWPEEAESDPQRLSVLAPLGTAILGYRVGDVVEWDVPAGSRRIKIEAILFQPEAEGEDLG
jgi:regulator of nucleoside diphosphate kinase